MLVFKKIHKIDGKGSVIVAAFPTKKMRTEGPIVSPLALNISPLFLQFDPTYQ